MRLVIAVLFFSNILASSSWAAEPCAWATAKAFYFLDLKTNYKFPLFALSRLAEEAVETEMTDRTSQEKAKLEGVLTGFVELMFDPESATIFDGTISTDEFGNLVYGACEDAM